MDSEASATGDHVTVQGPAAHSAGDGVAAAPRRRPAAWWASVRDARFDIAIVVAITIAAAALRLWDLGNMPFGLHGDEAWTGIDARRLLDRGWISPYVESALGQPTGPLYLTALFFKIFPQTTFTLRASMAVFGIATIPAAYLAFTAMFNRTVGAFSALLLTFMTWHLHLSRTAFMVTAWPFMEMLVLWVLWTGFRRPAWWRFMLAGVFWGLGVYSYNAYVLFLPIPLVAIAVTMLHARRSPEFKPLLRRAGVFIASGVIAAVPMLVYIAANDSTYREHQQVVSLTDSPEWKDAGIRGKADLLRDRADEWGRGLLIGDRTDLGDGLATPTRPVLDPLVVALALLGLGVVLTRWRTPESATIIAAVLILPLGALLTVSDGLFRRSFGLAPFVAALAAIPLAWVWQRICEQQGHRRVALGSLMVAVLAVVPGRAVYDYFTLTDQSFEMRFVYPYQVDAASKYIDRLPPGTFVYFYSDRWSFDYETRRFLAPDAKGEDRSREFPYERAFDAPLNFNAKPSGPIAFVMLGPYVENVNEVVKRYPGGQLTEERRGDEVVYRGYYVDREP